MTIANTILEQIRLADRAALMAWGVKEIVTMENGLRFKSSGMVRWKGYVEVVLDEGKDLYNIEFFKLRKTERKVTKRVEGVYCDELVPNIDAVVG